MTGTKKIKRWVGSLPLVGPLAKNAARWVRTALFPGSTAYWENRYAVGGTSGDGSYGKLAEFKAEVINSFIAEQKIKSAIEFGCGDGHQLSLINYPSYLGLDVSPSAIKRCVERFRQDATKSFFLYNQEHFAERGRRFKAELALSLDVLYHLVEDEIFHQYIDQLFSAAEKFVIIYSTNVDLKQDKMNPHVRHRRFMEAVSERCPEWRLFRKILNKYPAEVDPRGILDYDFFIYGKS